MTENPCDGCEYNDGDLCFGSALECPVEEIVDQRACRIKGCSNRRNKDGHVCDEHDTPWVAFIASIC